MKPERATNIIRYLSMTVTFGLAVGAFVLSYAALWDTAQSYGVPDSLAWLWPLLVDGAIIVFGLGVVRNDLLGERTVWPWLLVVIATAGTIILNGLHSDGRIVSIAVAIVAPIALVLAFETSMAMVKSDVRRSGAVLSTEQITAKLKELEAKYQEDKDNLESELEQTRRAGLAEIEAARLKLTEQIGQLESEQARLTEEVTAKANTLNSYIQDIEAKREELRTLDSGQLKIYAPDNLTIEQRRQLVNRMSQEGLTIEAIAAALGCSPGTVKNDKKANSTIRPLEEVAAESGHSRNGNHGAAKG